jgi:hypothetical protein
MTEQEIEKGDLVGKALNAASMRGDRETSTSTQTVERRKEFGVAARSYEITIQTDADISTVINHVHDWAVSKNYQFGGAISEIAETGYRIFGEFPPNKFDSDADTASITNDLKDYLAKQTDITPLLCVANSDPMDEGKARGVIGLKPGYGDAPVLDLGVAQDLLQKQGQLDLITPATIFYNFKDPTQPGGYARMHEPGVEVTFTLNAGTKIDQAVLELAQGLGQTSIQLVVGQGQDTPATHEAWKVKGLQTAREAASEQSRPS